MIISNLDIDQAISLVDNRIHPKHLNRVQEIILIKSLEGQTYSQIVIEYNYGMEYIKTSGSELWKLLSQAFGQQITKSNCNSFIRRQIAEFTANRFSLTRSTENASPQDAAINIEDANVSDLNQEIDSFSLIAPKTSNFQGRELELNMLQNWSSSLSCRFIMITGMIGCGKTTLAIKVAEMLKAKFHRVIYLSMGNSLKLTDSIKFCLHSLDPNFEVSSDINKLLVDLTLYLKKYRCLLVLDDLDSIVEFKQMESYYRSGYEQYAQFLRCLITSNHQSLIIANSHRNLKQLNYYSNTRVRFLFLKGMSADALWQIYASELEQNISKEMWRKICRYYQNNPEIIKIVVRNFAYLPISDGNIDHNYVPYIEEVDLIIEQELQLLDDIGRELVYWLAFNFENHTLTELLRRMNHQQTKLLKVIDFLKEHSLIVENNSNLTLQPMIKDYVQRYLIQAAKESSNYILVKR